MGHLGGAFAVGQAAARQRSASRSRLPRHLVPRAHGRAGLRHQGRLLARRRPAIVLGHNASIGWGFTTTNLDSQDLFIERIDPTDPNRYITPDGARPFAVREETINVLWGEPVHLRVRNTRHGVVIDDFIGRPDDLSTDGPCARAAGHRARRRRHYHRGADMRLAWRRTGTSSWPAGRKVVSPMQNIVYADTAGNIGLIAPARVPIRRKGDGSMPQPGWTGEYDWAGFVPFDELPQPTTRRAASSSTPTPVWCPTTTATSSAATGRAPYRQRRANALLREVERHPVYGMIADPGRQPLARRRRDPAGAAQRQAAQSARAARSTS